MRNASGRVKEETVADGSFSDNDVFDASRILTGRAGATDDDSILGEREVFSLNFAILLSMAKDFSKKMFSNKLMERKTKKYTKNVAFFIS